MVLPPACRVMLDISWVLNLGDTFLGKKQTFK